jgi:aminoglycoside phosphotransferase (APT) family kinase protein
MPGIVAKIYREPWRAANEFKAVRIASKAEMAVPAIVGSGSFRGRKFLLLRRISGRTVEQGEPAARQVLTYMQSLHQISGTGFGRIHHSPTLRWNDYMQKRLHQYREAFFQFQIREAIDSIDALRMRLLPEPTAASLLHNDPRPANFIQGKSGIVGIDWELAVYGDPNLDHARAGYEFGITSQTLERILDDLEVPYMVDTLRFYRRVHILGRLMSAVTAHPSNNVEIHRYRSALSNLSLSP